MKTITYLGRSFPTGGRDKAEFATLKVPKHRTPLGDPTCCRDLQEGKLCPFLRLCGMCGKIEYCMMTGLDLRRGGEDGFGFLIVGEGCPVWANYGGNKNE